MPVFSITCLLSNEANPAKFFRSGRSEVHSRENQFVSMTVVFLGMESLGAGQKANAPANQK